ncbi:sugar ABC transporter [Caballeronia sp. BCC1704]|uniref:sugar ABC transporter n=1 Tax=Caballeronia sp. BCC1704 TaxID=2676300 RepID=UPI001FC824CE|nr:sugar ABC transporter [Caballeronia sp. BCC1704]
MSESGSAIEARRRERDTARLARRRARWMMLALVLVPVALCAAYATLVAKPRYSAEARFSVRATSSAAPLAGGAASLFTTGGGAGVAAGFVDGWAVSDFLASRDCMRQLDERIGLRRRLTLNGLDLPNRLPSNASEDDLYRAYRSSVKVSYNIMEQVDVMQVSAYSPADAAAISEALLDLAQTFVQRMDEKGVEDALKVSRQAVALAQKEAQSARAALTKWRIVNQNLDPAANAAMLLNLSAQLETELNTAQINLDKIRALGNPQHPMLAPAAAQVQALTERLAQTRERISGKGKTQASQLGDYESLKNAEAFADSNLTATQQSYQQAFTDTLKLQRYLTVITRPLPTDRPTSPNVPLLLLASLAAGLALALVVRVAVMLGREFFNG